MRLKFAICPGSHRAFSGQRPAARGPALVQCLTGRGWEVTQQRTVPDDQNVISAMLTEWADGHQADIILTTGGTGFAPRDVTPEATLQVVEREAPGLAEMMRA